MAKQMTIPKYAPGSVIDLGHKYGVQMPNRIKIATVYIKDVDKGGWMYEVFSEMHNGATFMSEAMITERLSKHTSPCYSRSDIKKRYADGYRFCGNYPEFVAKDKADKMKEMKEVAGVILYRGINPNGKKMEGYYGLWVKYNTPISDNGDISQFDEECIIVK